MRKPRSTAWTWPSWVWKPIPSSRRGKCTHKQRKKPAELARFDWGGFGHPDFVLSVDCAVTTCQRSFTDRFRIGRVGVAGQGDIFGRSAKFHGNANLMDHVTGCW